MCKTPSDGAAAPQLFVALRNAGAGDPKAIIEFTYNAYENLRRSAHMQKWNTFGKLPITQETSEFVHEAIALMIDKQKGVNDEGHFLALASTIVAGLIKDHARRRGTGKRGAGQRGVSLDSNHDTRAAKDTETLALEVGELLEKYKAIDPESAEVLTLRCFGDQSVKEVAERLGMSDATVVRRYKTALAWFQVQMAK